MRNGPISFEFRYGKGFGIMHLIVGEDSVLNQPNCLVGMIFYCLIAALICVSTYIVNLVNLVLSVAKLRRLAGADSILDSPQTGRKTQCTETISHCACAERADRAKLTRPCMCIENSQFTVQVHMSHLLAADVTSLFLDFWLQELHSYLDDMFQWTSGIILRSDEKERTHRIKFIVKTQCASQCWCVLSFSSDLRMMPLLGACQLLHHRPPGDPASWLALETFRRHAVHCPEILEAGCTKDVKQEQSYEVAFTLGDT
uniref:Uncharacterized protein n=1 Tax=Timema tahoe TaxID=61484 RepID=A0A7R9IGI5_9NEOP|nr:unnamed protein product [Timema tahoe]